ncbi:MAG: fatty acid oxidation complex subunit alpha FadB, partial [Gammaproteobacteria bacterium]
PEVKLGICPGFGGTVRLPRVIGIDNAVEWVCTGRSWKPEQALKAGVADAVVPRDALIAAATRILQQAIAGQLDHAQRRRAKTSPVLLNDVERMMAFTTGKAVVAAGAGPHFPAPMMAAKSMEKSTPLDREGALKVEASTFARLAKTPEAESLVGLFLNEQDLQRRQRKLGAEPQAIAHAGVLGAGIMGGGIAYQSAVKGVPVLMKDIQSASLDKGMAEAAGLLSKQVERGKLSAADMGKTLSAIRPTLDYQGFGQLDMIVEAVVENPKIKQAVLAECEAQLPEHAILASNTSTIAITHLAAALKRPQNFCGMHFFNPVHRMPLVEVIRGQQSSNAAIATTVAYARTMGKTPIVVGDCPGFYVNRVLFPYLAGFSLLVRDGVPFRRIDKVMEKFGWPMGPAYLLDVVGIDTAHHAAEVMATGFPDRMAKDERVAMDCLFEAKRYGQKNGAGFYRYEGATGKPVKQDDPEVDALIAPVITGSLELDDQAIIDRVMLPLCMEAARCLEEGIIETAGDGDLGLAMGIGFPLFRGGIFRYMDQQGLDVICQKGEALAALGALYAPTSRMQELAKAGKGWYTQEVRS